MNEKIRELAEQAGFYPSENYDHSNWHAAGFGKNFERFAKLVAAAERELCAKLCEEMKWNASQFDCAAAIRGRQT